MKYPQTFCHDIKDSLKSLTPERLDTIHRYGCCAFVLLWTLGIEPDDELTAVLTVNDMINAGVIDSECTVDWMKSIKFLTGRDASVDFVSIKDILGIKNRTPVRYDYKGASHWVGVERGKIAFNPLKSSQCVEKGSPVTSRVITLKR